MDEAAAVAAAAARGEGTEGTDGSDVEGRTAHHAGEALSSYDELEAAISDDDEVAAGARDGSGGVRDPWAPDDQAAMARAAYGMGPMVGEPMDPAGGQYMSDSTTGLAVAATFQRMKVWMDMDHQSGVVTVFAVEVGRWLKRRREAAAAAAEEEAALRGGEGLQGPPAGSLAAAPGVQHNQHTPGGALGPAGMGVGLGVGMGVAGARLGMRGGLGRVGQQQRDIRLGMMGPGAGQQGPRSGSVGGAGSGMAGGSSGNGMFGGPPHGGAPSQGPHGGEGRSRSTHPRSASVSSAPSGPGSAPPSIFPSDPRAYQRPVTPPARRLAPQQQAPSSQAPEQNGAHPRPLSSQVSTGSSTTNGASHGEHANGRSTNGSANGTNGSANGGTNGGAASQYQRPGSVPGAEQLLIAIPQQQKHQVEVSVGPVSMPVTISTMSSAAAAAAAAAATEAGAAAGAGSS